MSGKIIILHQKVGWNAPEDERDTLEQAAFVRELLRDEGWKVETLSMGLDLEKVRRRLLLKKPHAVFNLVESLAGKGEFIHFAPGLLESLRLPFTGSSARALFLTSHKILAKKIMRSAGIPTPDWRTPDEQAGGIPASFFPCLRKSLWEHASAGMDDAAFIVSEEKLKSTVMRGNEPFFLEKFIEGREFNIALLEDDRTLRTLEPSEIVFTDYPHGKPKILGFNAKWKCDTFEYQNTPRTFDFPASDEPLLNELKKIAVRCFNLFGLSGYARVDFRVDGRGRPWVLEINANPCLTPDGGFFASAMQSGYTPSTLFRAILSNAFHDKIERGESLS